MSMFCHQCQEAAKGTGCDRRGVCGKDEPTANMQDLLIHILQGIATIAQKSPESFTQAHGVFISKALFATITNANFDEADIADLVEQALVIRNQLKTSIECCNKGECCTVPDCVTWTGSRDEYTAKAATVGIKSYSDNEDIVSLKSLLLFGIKGSAAYAEHAAVLGFYNKEIFDFFAKALAAIPADLDGDTLTALVLEAGDIAVKTMALLDEANTTTYGNPELSTVKLGVSDKPGILVSGHDLRDLADLLEQTQGTGVDVYTHSEMLPAHYYPAFKKYDNFIGNYGNAWWKQGTEFTSFNGPILMTTNCITPVKDAYKDRIFITGMVGYPGTKKIADRNGDGSKDFSEIIALAKTCPAPTEIETGEIVGGFAHNQVMALADKVVDAVKSGAVKRFVVMAGCDGRMPSRQYFTDVAEGLPKDMIILTAGCAKYRYNKLNLGDIGGIPRVLDAGQCNDSYSLAVIALKLKEVFGLDDINDLPISYDIAWYEQKAVTVLLALLSLGVKGIRLGPTLPAFLSANVAKVLVDNFDIKPTGEVAADIAAITAGC